MNRDDSRRAAKDLATAALQNLYTAFSGDGDVQNVVASVLEQVSSIDVKPQVPALGAPVVVIGDAVAAPPHIAALESTEESSAPRQNKRQRRTANVELTLQNFPPNGCEVLIPRHDGQQRWNQYCRVVGHTATGQLVIDVPGESAPLERSIYGLRGGLGSDEERPLMRTCSSREAGLAPLPQSAEEQAATAHPHPSSGSESSSSVAAASSSAVPAPASASFPSPTIDERSGEEQAATSKLRRSEGRTREELNRHLADLGLKAKFGQTVVSAKEGVLSHLTFNVGDWNNLPQTEQEPFIWWLGDGEKRAAAGQPRKPRCDTAADRRSACLLRSEAQARWGALLLWWTLYHRQLRESSGGSETDVQRSASSGTHRAQISSFSRRLGSGSQCHRKELELRNVKIRRR